MRERLDWMESGICMQTDPEAFFPEKGETNKPSKQVCASCDVAATCLEYALDNDVQFGVWGGKSSRERNKILRDRKAAAALESVEASIREVA